VVSRRRATGAAIAAIGVIVLGAPQLGAKSRPADDDVPKRQPVLAWEVPVECDGSAALASVAGHGHDCDLAFDHELVFVHEHPGSVTADGVFRLSALDITTGALRWSHDVGESYEIRLTDEAVILSDKEHIEVFDAATGALRFTRSGRLVNYNRYGVLVMDAANDSITGVDASDGTDLWTMPGAVGAMCRDFVAVVPAGSDPAAPFSLVDHRSGRVRWTSEADFDPSTYDIACSGAPWIYVTDGERVYELDSLDGWTTWETAVPDADAVDLYREVALVTAGGDSGMITAVRRDDGVVLWQLPTADVGASLSWVGRLREDARGLFTLHPLTGETVQRVDLASETGSTFDVVGVSDTRVVVAVGSVITAFGMNDLGVAWQLDVGGVPDDFGVSAGYLVVRTGGVLRGYSSARSVA
jgi:outer membrane protein assembly factor BamB